MANPAPKITVKCQQICTMQDLIPLLYKHWITGGISVCKIPQVHFWSYMHACKTSLRIKQRCLHGMHTCSNAWQVLRWKQRCLFQCIALQCSSMHSVCPVLWMNECLEYWMNDLGMHMPVWLFEYGGEQRGTGQSMIACVGACCSAQYYG